MGPMVQRFPEINEVSRNPILDLGVLSEEATVQHIRGQLAALLEQHIGRKGWNQAEASRALRVARITVRQIVNGKLQKLPIDLLIKLLARAGLNVEISVSGGALGPKHRRRLSPKMTQRQLIARDSKRDLGAELLQAARQMKAGHAARTWRVSTTRKTLILEDDFGRRFVRQKGKIPKSVILEHGSLRDASSDDATAANRLCSATTRRATSRARMKGVKK